MTLQLLDVVVLVRDIPTDGLQAGDLGTIVELLDATTFEVEFVAASGRTQALVTLTTADIRPVRDDDLVSVRPTHAAR
jgi:hypothetical protein